MADDTLRSIEMTRTGKGRFEATNSRGERLVVGEGGFSPIELLLTAIAGCSAMDVDYITGKRTEPTRFEVSMSGHKVRDDNGNRLVDLLLSFHVEFDDDEDGRTATERVPGAVQMSHDRLCTVSRTVEVGTPIRTRVEKVG